MPAAQMKKRWLLHLSRKLEKIYWINRRPWLKVGVFFIARIFKARIEMQGLR